MTVFDGQWETARVTVVIARVCRLALEAEECDQGNIDLLGETVDDDDGTLAPLREKTVEHG